MKKAWPIIIVVVVLVTALVVWEIARPDATVDVLRPRTGTIRAYVEERAITELPHDYLIAMPIGGWLAPIDLREGDPVKKDQVVARLDRDDLADRVQQVEKRIAVLETNIRDTTDNRLEDNILSQTIAMVKAFDETVKASQAKLQASQAIMDFANSEVERLNQVREARAAADQELRAVQTEYRRARAEYQSDVLEHAALKTLQAVSYLGPKYMKDYIDRKSFKKESYEQQLAEARAELAIAKRNLGRTEIKSPIDGVVLNRLETRRQFLQPGTPLLTLGRLEDIEVTAEVLTERATRIAPGNPVEVFGEAIVGGPVTGKVSRVYPAGFKKISSLGVEQQRVKVAVTFDPDQRPDNLGVEFRVHVRIFYDRADNALVLPRTALFRGKQGNWQVMRIADGLTERQTVVVGIMNDDHAQILEGLTSDDRVVARPSREIVENMRVKTNLLEPGKVRRADHNT